MVAKVEVAAAYTFPAAVTARPPNENGVRVSWFETARFVEVAAVLVDCVKTAVLGVVAPIGVFSIVPPEIVRLFATCASVALPMRSAKLMPRVEVANATTFPRAPVLFPRMVFAATCASLVNATPFVARVSVEFAPPTSAPRVPVMVNSAEGVKEVVATEPIVVKPDVLVKYERPETAMSEVVAISSRSFEEMVTFPVAPETAIPEPATLERTPVLLKAVPSYESPVPAVVVAVLNQPVTPFCVPYASTCPATPVKRLLVVVAIESTEGVVPKITAGLESARAPEAVSVVVATEPMVVRPLVFVKYERPEIAMSEVVAISNANCPAPAASDPSHKSAEPVIEVQNADHAVAVTPPKERLPETLRFVVVADVEVESVKTPVEGVAAPIGVFSIVPPSMVRLFATCASVADPTRLAKVMFKDEVLICCQLPPA